MDSERVLKEILEELRAIRQILDNRLPKSPSAPLQPLNQIRSDKADMSVPDFDDVDQVLLRQWKVEFSQSIQDLHLRTRAENCILRSIGVFNKDRGEKLAYYPSLPNLIFWKSGSLLPFDEWADRIIEDSGLLLQMRNTGEVTANEIYERLIEYKELNDGVLS